MTLAGKRFAYREKAYTLGEPVRPVEVVKEGPRRTQKVRVRWLDGEYVGLEEWVPKGRLVAPFTIDNLDEMAPRLGLTIEDLLSQPHAFVARHGEYKAPFAVALRVAEAELGHFLTTYFVD